MIANENGDWWEYKPGQQFYVLDTEEMDPADKAKAEEDWGPLDHYPDKLERVIWEYGKVYPTSYLFEGDY